jgi:hypothetical protein
MVQDTATEFISLVFKCTLNGAMFLRDVLNTLLETLLTIMLVSGCGQILQNCESMCVILLEPIS